VSLPSETFDFLGYTFGVLLTRTGHAYLGTRPSRKSIGRIIERLHAETDRGPACSIRLIVQRLNRLLQAGRYFCLGQ